VGSRSKARARAQVSEAREPEVAQRPSTLTWAAVIQAVEAVGVLLASVLAGVDAARGQSYHVNSGIALTVIGLGAAIALGYVALGIIRLKPWSRTPAVITQLFCVLISVYLLQAHRYAWGVPGMLLGVAGLVMLFIPQSFRALASRPPEPPARGQG
jgi:hypothetical protein